MTDSPVTDLIRAVGELLTLKDGPRDSMYYQLKPQVWERVRTAYGQIMDGVEDAAEQIPAGPVCVCGHELDMHDWTGNCGGVMRFPPAAGELVERCKCMAFDPEGYGDE